MTANPSTVTYAVETMRRLGWKFRISALDGFMEIKPGENQPWSNINDSILAHFRHTARKNGVQAWTHALDGLQSEAFQNTYNPLTDYLNKTAIDGNSHISKLAEYFDETPLIDNAGLSHYVFERFLRRWLIGAVRRAVEPSGEQNRMLVLDAPQGIGKSQFVRWLCPPELRRFHFFEGAIIPNHPDHLRRLMTTWIWEVSELGSTTRRADVDSLKQFISTQLVRVRFPYGRGDTQGPARTSFIGTVNNAGAGVLNDPTGNRRFMFAKIENIDWDYSKDIDPNQVWAEAYALYLAGEPAELNAEENALAAMLNEFYQMDNPVESLLEKYFEVDPDKTNWFVPTVDIEGTIQDEYRQSREKLRREVNTILVTRGCQKARQRGRTGGNPERGFTGIRRLP